MLNDKEFHSMLLMNTKLVEDMLTEMEAIVSSTNLLMHGRHLENYGFFACAKLNNLIFANRVEEFQKRFDSIFDEVDDRTCFV